MTDNKLLITDDLKSAFADLLGRNSRTTDNTSDIKIDGKQMSLHANSAHIHTQNPSHNLNQTNAPTNNVQYISSLSNITVSESQFASSTPSQNITPHSTPTNPTKHRSLSAASTPHKGSVLASYIQQFRSAPAKDPNQRNTKTNEFWWIKNPTQNKYQQRPNTAPNTTYSIHHEEKQVSNEVTKQKYHQQMTVNKPSNNKSHSVSSSFSDDMQIVKEMDHPTPKPIEYTQSNVSKHSAMIETAQIKDEETESDKEMESTSHCFVNQDVPIDVDDILEKWRKKRRLTELATEHGMNTNHYQDNTMSNLFNNDDELERIKKRLGLVSNDEEATLTQPFAATIHPIPFRHHCAPNTDDYPQYLSHKTSHQSKELIVSENFRCYSPTPTTPIAQNAKAESIVYDEKYEHKEERKILSPRKRQNLKTSSNFLLGQQHLREQRAKTERIARIQRRMCFDEKNVLDHSKSVEKVYPTGRQKRLASPSPRKIHCKIQKKLNFEEKDEIDDDDTPSRCDINNAISDDGFIDILQLSSKSVQTQADVLTPKNNSKIANNFLNICETKTVRSEADPTELLPKDIMNTLNTLYENGILKNEKDFDIHFKKILSEHNDNKKVASKLLKFIDDSQCDDHKNMDTQFIKPPLPSPQKIGNKEYIDDDLKENQDKEIDIKDNESESECKVERVLTVSLCCDISNIEDNNINNENYENDLHHDNYIESDIKAEHVLSVSLCCDISNTDDNDITESVIQDNDIIANWIKQHPDHYWPPSKQSDIQVIKDFIERKNVENVNKVSSADDQKISIRDDAEIMTLIQSCKNLRHNISNL